jgi:hypothetical protein
VAEQIFEAVFLVQELRSLVNLEGPLGQKTQAISAALQSCFGRWDA